MSDRWERKRLRSRAAAALARASARAPRWISRVPAQGNGAPAALQCRRRPDIESPIEESIAIDIARASRAGVFVNPEAMALVGSFVNGYRSIEIPPALMIDIYHDHSLALPIAINLCLQLVEDMQIYQIYLCVHVCCDIRSRASVHSGQRK